MRLTTILILFLSTSALAGIKTREILEVFVSANGKYLIHLVNHMEPIKRPDGGTIQIDSHNYYWGDPTKLYELSTRPLQEGPAGKVVSLFTYKTIINPATIEITAAEAQVKHKEWSETYRKLSPNNVGLFQTMINSGSVEIVEFPDLENLRIAELMFATENSDLIRLEHPRDSQEYFLTILGKPPSRATFRNSRDVRLVEAENGDVISWRGSAANNALLKSRTGDSRLFLVDIPEGQVTIRLTNGGPVPEIHSPLDNYYQSREGGAHGVPLANHVKVFPRDDGVLPPKKPGNANGSACSGLGGDKNEGL